VLIAEEESLVEAETAKSTVYFDGSCPLCRTEIAHYRGIDSDGSLCFVDVSRKETDLPHDLTQQQAMKRFHVRAVDGQLLWRHSIRRSVEAIAKMALGGACRGSARSAGRT